MSTPAAKSGRKEARQSTLKTPRKTIADGGQTASTVENAGEAATEKRGSVAAPVENQRLSTLESSFNEPLDQYRLGNWGNRSTYLPKLDWSEDNPTLVARFKELVEARNMDQIRILLHAGVPPNLAIYPYKRTALHFAAERGDELMCQLLLSFKADPLLEDDSPPTRDGDPGHWTPRIIARKNQHLQLTHLFNAHCGFTELLDVGPDPGPLKSDKPMRCHLEAHEPGFMSSTS
mmetsp:Transcript_71444/g.136244  ORF Transcript_71444/g.136244 Transcript_71444/m.136244 type:complete len:233 (-) Transcript_71444:75-773(-)